MKVVIQRVKKASALVDGSVVGNINTGLLVLIGITQTDSTAQIEWIANKLANLRIFEDESGAMNCSLLEVEAAGILFVSNFTLYGNAQKGFRPSFTAAANSAVALPIYQQFMRYFRDNYADKMNIQEGVFGAMMDIELINDGPVTIIIEKNAVPN